MHEPNFGQLTPANITKQALVYDDLKLRASIHTPQSIEHNHYYARGNNAVYCIGNWN